MAYLQDAHNAARLAEIDRHGIEVLPVWRSRVLRRLARAAICGHLGDVGGQPAAIYLAGGRLWLAVDGQAWHLDEVEAEIDSHENGCAVVIRTPQHEHRVSVDTNLLSGDTTPFASLEDFSFGLWAARIIQNSERRQVLCEVLNDASLEAMPEHARLGADESVVHMPQWRLDGQHVGEGETPS